MNLVLDIDFRVPQKFGIPATLFIYSSLMIRSFSSIQPRVFCWELQYVQKNLFLSKRDGL